MDKADIFTKVKSHLLAQGKQAMEGDVCQYRTEEGLRCAIGCLIPDGHPGLHSCSSVTTLVATNPDLRILWGVKTNDDIYFLQKLQHIHDENEPDKWSGLLDTFEVNNGL